MLPVLSIWANGRDQYERFLDQGAQVRVGQVAGLDVYRPDQSITQTSRYRCLQLLQIGGTYTGLAIHGMAPKDYQCRSYRNESRVHSIRDMILNGCSLGNKAHTRLTAVRVQALEFSGEFLKFPLRTTSNRPFQIGGQVLSDVLRCIFARVTCYGLLSASFRGIDMLTTDRLPRTTPSHMSGHAA